MQIRLYPAVLILVGIMTLPTEAADPASVPIPHNQKSPPGPARSPAEAIDKMQVPPGFAVEVVASEPDVMNPVAMAIDERGRFWITESFEYPRRSPGPGRDRIKILEDTDHDGRVDKVTIFAEGLNIPSGIALGYGGVWVANSPDILFLQDTDGDDRADQQKVVVTGFGRDDTHELPNSLTWGPDGWLYGLNGVFNHSHIVHQGKTFDFTCALFRIHPRTHEFQLFAQGTSNPWGVAFDQDGSAFVSACVIDHLWHLTESGYYHRQGGPYPPYTWKLESIVKHKHQMAAYCGITFFDSDAYPAEFRDKLYMGNIHGGCINVDYLTRDGSTYLAKPAPDFLTANDAWFMPVVQKTGPDGCLYVLDWYDRYHCYQDANRDPEGIDRGRGRLYRIRYQDSPRATPFNLIEESNERLIERLHSPNIYFRDLAQRLLSERSDRDLRTTLRQIVVDDQQPRKARMHALWALIGGGALDPSFHQFLLSHADPALRAWGVRAAGNQGNVTDEVREQVGALAADENAAVRLQVAIAAKKLNGMNSLDVLCRVLEHPGDDILIPHIVWQNLQPLLEKHHEQFVSRVIQLESPSEGFVQMLPQAVSRLLDSAEPSTVARLMAHVIRNDAWTTRSVCLQAVRDDLLRQSDSPDHLTDFRAILLPALLQAAARADSSQRNDCLLVSALLGDANATTSVRRWTEPDSAATHQQRLDAFLVLVALQDQDLVETAQDLLAHGRHQDPDELARVVATICRADEAGIATLLLDNFDQLPNDVRPRIVEQLTQRNEWAKLLLTSIAAQRISRDALHINQIRRLKDSGDRELAQQVEDIWGTIRDGRNPQVEEAVDSVRQLVQKQAGNAERGETVFHRHCGQCHQMYGRGEQVGPDISANGRSSFEQLLSNVFDPNLVIGSAYQSYQVVTTDGRSLSGLLVLETPDRIVLKLQGGKEESLARSEIEELTRSPLSLMPEGWEKQLTEQELVDLMHFITLDGPPNDPNSQRLPGTPELLD